jgi:hypothetical protein
VQGEGYGVLSEEQCDESISGNRGRQQGFVVGNPLKRSTLTLSDGHRGGVRFIQSHDSDLSLDDSLGGGEDEQESQSHDHGHCRNGVSGFASTPRCG